MGREAVIAYAENEGADVIGMDFIRLPVACDYYTKKYGSLTNPGIVFGRTVGVNAAKEKPWTRKKASVPDCSLPAELLVCPDINILPA